MALNRALGLSIAGGRLPSLSERRGRVGRRRGGAGRRMAFEPLEDRTLLSVLSGTVFDDQDGDRVRDAGEPGMAGVTVYLDSNDNGRLDAGEPSRLTDANGGYAFTDVAAGARVVREVAPTGYQQTSPSAAYSRLFAGDYTGGGKIYELNPATGATIRQFSTPVTGPSSWQGLAFDGSVLYFVADATTDVLYQLDPNTGAVLAQTTLPSGSYDGLAAIGGQVYAMDTGSDKIQVFDPATGSVVKTIDLVAANPGRSFFGGLGEIAGPDALIAGANGYEITLLDPGTGKITYGFGQGTTSTPYGLTSINQ